MDPMGLMRVASLLGVGKKKRPEDFEETVTAQPPQSDWETLLTQEGPAMGEYRKHLGTMPRQEDHKPSFFRRLGAGALGALAGVAGDPQGVQNAARLTTRPYRNAVNQWKMKGDTLQEAAQLEGTQTRNRITGRKMDIDEADRTVDNERQLQQLEVQRQNAKTNEERARIDEEIKRARLANDQERLKFDQNMGYGRLDAQNRRTGVMERDVNSKIDFRTKRAAGQGAKGPTPQAQDSADRLAVTEVLRQNPEFNAFVDKTTGAFLPPERGMEEQYDLFLEAIKHGKRKIIRDSGFGGYGNDIELNNEDEEDY